MKKQMLTKRIPYISIYNVIKNNKIIIIGNAIIIKLNINNFDASKNTCHMCSLFL